MKKQAVRDGALGGNGQVEARKDSVAFSTGFVDGAVVYRGRRMSLSAQLLDI